MALTKIMMQRSSASLHRAYNRSNKRPRKRCTGNSKKEMLKKNELLDKG